MAALAIAYPGYVCSTVMGTHLFASRACGHPQLPHLQQPHLSSHSLPMLAYVQRAWESAHGQYPVTLAFLELTHELINSGVSAESVQVAWVLLHDPHHRGSLHRKGKVQLLLCVVQNAFCTCLHACVGNWQCDYSHVSHTTIIA